MLPERRGVYGGSDLVKAADHGLPAVRRSRRSGRRKLLFWIFSFAALFSICIATFGFKMFFHGVEEHQSFSSSTYVKDISVESNTTEQPKKKPHRARFNPCKVDLKDSVEPLVEPKTFWNFVKFSLQYVMRENIQSHANQITPRFGGHQTLEEREQSFHAVNQTIHCGFAEGLISTGFDLDKEDKLYMNTCTVVVSSCIFGSSDFLRRPTSKMISRYSKENVCFVMFVDKETLVKLSNEGSVPDEKGFIGLWRMVVVSNLPYDDMRKTGKVPKFLSHRLFPSARYSIWLDSKLRLHTDPMQLIEYFLWRNKAEYAISNHYTRHWVWDEVQQNKRLNKYNHTAIDQQFLFYQSDGLHKFDPYDPYKPLPSYVPEGSVIIRAHTPMSNLFSCLWFNEVDRFTSRDQLSFGYTFLKLKKTNPDKPFVLHMFKDCERRAITKLFHHRNP
ncbi:putative hexosyltransferase MUCI70 isoform X1 [Bidens hawaiensis]|uniref:putative hexosyltransferase MUCI70 isoform X1 n=1 Tax=Bidens hawaiensis TaxID=980011 RepID=UPI00404A2AC8